MALVKQVAHFYDSENKVIRTELLMYGKLCDIGKNDGKTIKMQDGEVAFSLCHIRTDMWTQKLECVVCLKNGFYDDILSETDSSSSTLTFSEEESDFS